MKVEREKAKEIILSKARKLPWEYKTLNECYFRTLAQDVRAEEELPNANLSAIDGFALRSEETKERRKFKVVGEVGAGQEPDFTLGEGECAFVMTGAIVPKGADAAVRVEDAEYDEEKREVTIKGPVERGELINFAGSEVRKGELLLREGQVLTPRRVALLAHAGIYRVKVFQKPKVAVITTGNEVLEPYQPGFPGAVRNTNFYLLKGLLEEAGAEVVYLGTAPDDREETVRLLREACKKADAVVTTGGVSKGKYDFVKDAVEKAGFQVAFTSTNVRPGRPLVFGTNGEVAFFGLPGYPTATLVNALEFLLPFVRKVAGRRDYENNYVTAVAKEPLRAREGRVDFVRVKIEVESGTVTVRNGGSQKTAFFKSAALCDGFAVIGADRGTVKEGELVEVLPLNL